MLLERTALINQKQLHLGIVVRSGIDDPAVYVEEIKVGDTFITMGNTNELLSGNANHTRIETVIEVFDNGIYWMESETHKRFANRLKLKQDIIAKVG